MSQYTCDSCDNVHANEFETLCSNCRALDDDSVEFEPLQTDSLSDCLRDIAHGLGDSLTFGGEA